MTNTDATTKVTHISAEQAVEALETAGHCARIWRGGKVARLYVQSKGDYLPIDRDGDVDVEDVRSCSSISSSARRWRCTRSSAPPRIARPSDHLSSVSRR